MENNGKRFYLTIRGQEVEVSEEVYRAYIQPVRAERRRKQRAFRCKIKGKKGTRAELNCLNLSVLRQRTMRTTKTVRTLPVKC